MTQSTPRPARMFLVAAVGALACLTAGVNAAESNKWRLEVSGNAESAGTIVLEVRPKGGDAITRVEVPVAQGTAENDVAQAIAAALQAGLNTQAVKVELDDGEDVLLKRADGAADFDVTVVSSTLKDVRLQLDKE